MSRFSFLYPHSPWDCSNCIQFALIEHLLHARHGVLTYTICDLQSAEQERSLLVHIHTASINSHTRMYGRLLGLSCFILGDLSGFFRLNGI